LKHTAARSTLASVPIPDLTVAGLLPEGLYDCTMDEVDERFGRFNKSDRRIELVRQLRSYCSELKGISIAGFIVVDGSFVTNKDEPGDIDILLALRPGTDLSKDLAPFEYNAISKRRVSRKYPFDLLVAPEGSEAYEKHLDFFSQVKGRPGLRKGLLKVTP
jgi:hypothetical protein